MGATDNGQSIPVLIVEDDHVLGELLEEYLAARGMTATPVDTLASARELLKRHQFDVVVLDLNLGGDDGLVLARELAEGLGPPVVIAGNAAPAWRARSRPRPPTST